MQSIRKSNKLADVCYDIRGPVLQEAKRLEEEGYRITKLNIGNPAPYGIMADMMQGLQDAKAPRFNVQTDLEGKSGLFRQPAPK